jgi:hypothetical protein
MQTAVFLLCALTSLACAFLLARAYARNKIPLLFWSTACFIGLALNNALLLVNIYTETDLTLWRKLPAVVGIVLLVHGLVAESR